MHLFKKTIFFYFTLLILINVFEILFVFYFNIILYLIALNFILFFLKSQNESLNLLFILNTKLKTVKITYFILEIGFVM